MENAYYIVAMFNDLLSRFSKARKIKCPSFFRGTQRLFSANYQLGGANIAYNFLLLEDG